MRISMECKLQCGCTLKNSILSSFSSVGAGETVKDAEEGKRTVTNLSDILGYWLEIRMGQHECALVTEENPAGSRSIAERLVKKDG